MNKLRVLNNIEAEVGGLSTPSKMPWYGWSISASRCKTGGKLAKIPGTVCSDCYAMRGRYNFDATKNALERRLDTYNADAPRVWIDNMVELLNRKAANVEPDRRYFRWFDSGDLQSLDMLESINSVCLGTPSVTHYLPTKEYRIIKHFRNRIETRKTVLAPNLVIRVSAPYVDKPFKTARYYGFGTSVTKSTPSEGSCPAYLQGGKCLDCRACWDDSIDVIPYPLH